MGKGDKPRPVNRAAWDGALYWRELGRRKARAAKCRKKLADYFEHVNWNDLVAEINAYPLEEPFDSGAKRKRKSARG